MRRFAFALSWSLLSSVGPSVASAQPHADAGVGASSVAWRLTSEPATATITMSQRRGFRLWMEARNAGPRTADTERDRVEWSLNGERSMMLDLAWGNGAREHAWYALPPGGHVREARDMGEHLFPAPGSYELAMRLDGRVVARLRVRVVADPAAR